MNCNPEGIALIKKWEQLRLYVYPDTNGYPTAGWGQRVDLPMGSEVTQEQADNWFSGSVMQAEHAVDSLTRYELSSNEFSALVCFVYNVGATAFEHSAILTCINDGDLEEVPFHLAQWVHDNKGHKLQGLINRREDEIALWNTPDQPDQNINSAT